MWIFSKYGFYSIVRKEETPKVVYHVRSRVRNDLINLQKASGIENEVLFTEHTDYAYRMIVDESAYSQIMYALESSIDYSNFKSMIHERPDQRDKPYHEIWGILAEKYGAYLGFRSKFFR